VEEGIARFIGFELPYPTATNVSAASLNFSTRTRRTISGQRSERCLIDGGTAGSRGMAGDHDSFKSCDQEAFANAAISGSDFTAASDRLSLKRNSRSIDGRSVAIAGCSIPEADGRTNDSDTALRVRCSAFVRRAVPNRA
jgi:hypothetical protein